MSTRSTITAHCAARAAIAGNPSDAYGGAVVSVPVRSVAATVTVTSGKRFEVDHSPTGTDTFTDLDELVDSVDRFGYGDARQLIIATLRSLRRHLDADVMPASISAHTTIPRSVGLAGSSAIVIATARALAELHPTTRWARLLDDPAVLAAVALSAERDELGIAAGLQDRVVQAFDEPVAMDFAETAPLLDGPLVSGTYRTLPTAPGDLFVAALDAAASHSGIAHRSLRSDHDSDVGGIRRIMADIAEQGRAAAHAIERGDLSGVGEAMDATLDLRQSMMVLDPRLVSMAETARGVGGHANWSGSGGAITVLAPNATIGDAIRAELTHEHASRIIELGG